MSGARAALLALLAAVGLSALAAPDARALDVTIELGGGSVLEWDAPDQVGNCFGAGVFLGFGDLAVGLAGAAVLPDSRTQGQFGAFWIEGRWAPFHLDIPLSPYALVGFGLATSDDFQPRGDVLPAARWVTDGISPLGTAGLGVRFGAPTGLQVALDVRVYNHTHGGVNLIAEYTF
ncbi:MAG: hypothetical protein KC635_21380 [Myxococcales bacterium]|nr:hypothetical protein [Myxococcales bacterium]MCB9731247.1 hypothetical protein [Deltaproteobacteria bacterium]